jgi:type II secretory pathway pseudopilin PulG
MVAYIKQIFNPLKNEYKTSQRSLTGFMLAELLVVIIIIGVLIGVIYPNYVRTREQTMDKQAQRILKLIRIAERNYKIKYGVYCCQPPLNQVDDINEILGLDLVNEGEWSFQARAPNNPAPPQSTFRARLGRNKGGYSREWIIRNNDAEASCNFVSGSNWCP